MNHHIIINILFIRCETLIVRLASKSKLQSDTPEIFLSGALHGDERLGPTTLLELIRLACHMYGKHPIMTFLVSREYSNGWPGVVGRELIDTAIDLLFFPDRH